jgi:hypothetical protein
MLRAVSVLVAIQESVVSLWIRESDWAIFAFLIAHTIAMGFVVGTSIAIGLRVLGAARRVPLALLPKLFPLLNYALAVVILSGILLVIAYPAKALLNPLFYVKLTIVASAWVLTRRLARRVAQRSVDSDVIADAARSMTIMWAIACAVLWLSGITAGKFLEYTHKVLLIY